MVIDMVNRVLKAVLCLVVTCSGTMRIHAQQASTHYESLRFEVATVKPVEPGKPVHIEMRVYPGGRLVVHGYPLRSLLCDAFNLPTVQVVGGDRWLDEEMFDIEAKPSEELRAQILDGEYSSFVIKEPRVRAMLQNLLIERFRLKFHQETQTGTVYWLERGDGPLRLTSSTVNLYKRAEDGTVSPSTPYSTGQMGLASGAPVSLHQTSMGELARSLSIFKHAPVIDHTELTGYYNFRSKTVVSDDDFKAGNVSDLFVQALPEMGLKLVKTQGPIEKMVIDSAERPIDN